MGQFAQETNAIPTPAHDAAVQGAAGGAPLSPAALQNAAMPNISLTYGEEGVFLQLNEPLPPDMQQPLVQHIARKEIAHLDGEALKKVLAGDANGPKLIAPPQEEHTYNETYALAFEDNYMFAYMTLQPPENGKGQRLDPAHVIEELKTTHQITNGLEEEAVYALLASPVYGQRVCVATGLAPIPGEDGKLLFHFDKREGGNSAFLREVGESEKVDFRSLNIFESVTKGQKLVTKVLPQEGVPGRNLLGREVNAPTGKTYNMPTGKNVTFSDDKLIMYAKTSGRVDYINNSVVVSNCYVVEGDVDYSVGNIDFDGDVQVRGNVLAGFSINATGNIEVAGIVGAASLTAGKDVVLHGGMQGSGRGMLTAQGGVFVRFVEYATVQANEIVVADSLLHSNVNCYGAIETLNGKGSIVGGNVCAGTYIATRYLGNPSGRTTQLEVGISPRMRASLLQTKESVKLLEEVVSRLQNVLKAPPQPNESERIKAARMDATRKLLSQKKLLDETKAQEEKLKAQVEQMRDGQVHALIEAYPGVSIQISFERYVIHSPISFATFRMEGNEINFTSCRFTKAPSSSAKRPKKE